MPKGRLEAFSDGVIAIIITIMVLEMKVPHGDRLQDLTPLLPVFLSYILSFVYVRIYWNNQHHMLHTCSVVTGAMPLSQPLSVVLAIAVSVRHRMDGREPFHRRAHRTVWRGASDGRDRILPAPAGNHPRARPGFTPEKSGRQRLEGKALACAVSYCNRRDVAFAMDRPGGLCGRRADLADSGSAYRKGPATQSLRVQCSSTLALSEVALCLTRKADNRAAPSVPLSLSFLLVLPR